MFLCRVVVTWISLYSCIECSMSKAQLLNISVQHKSHFQWFNRFCMLSHVTDSKFNSIYKYSAFITTCIINSIKWLLVQKWIHLVIFFFSFQSHKKINLLKLELTFFYKRVEIRLGFNLMLIVVYANPLYFLFFLFPI